jgi:hypothetical protein
VPSAPPALGSRLGRARSQNAQSQLQVLEDVCPASRHYSAPLEYTRNSPSGPFKAVARVQIPLGPPTEGQGQSACSRAEPTTSRARV